MESEKVKEIKKVLEEGQFNTITHHQKEGNPIKISFADILTYIKELENENERLKTSEFNSYQELDNASTQIHNLEKRVAELENGIAKSMLGYEFLRTNEKLKKLKEKNQRLKDCIVPLLEEIIGEEELTLCGRRGVESTNFEELCAMGGLAWQLPLCPPLSYQNEKIRKAIEELLND